MKSILEFVNRNNIKAIAFDMIGVFLKENDFKLNSTEIIIEKYIGNINNQEQMFNFYEKELNIPKKEIQKHLLNICDNLYELREPDIFKKLPKNLKFAIASNFPCELHNIINRLKIRDQFNFILISNDIGIGKPDLKFYEILCKGLKEKPENILFIDDTLNNIEGAKKIGLQTIYYQRQELLSKSILNYMENT